MNSGESWGVVGTTRIEERGLRPAPRAAASCALVPWGRMRGSSSKDGDGVGEGAWAGPGPARVRRGYDLASAGGSAVMSGVVRCVPSIASCEAARGCVDRARRGILEPRAVRAHGGTRRHGAPAGPVSRERAGRGLGGLGHCLACRHDVLFLPSLRCTCRVSWALYLAVLRNNRHFHPSTLKLSYL